ncbi:MAG TPA: hypothetical protein VNQ76_14625 [Planctomicrobium sp.]|nr:hypothetical protein [Planctomicrobium sp.]
MSFWRFAAVIGVLWGGSPLIHQAMAQPGPQAPRYQPQPSPGPGPAPVVRIEFGRRTDADRLANQLVTQANALCLQLHQNYQGNPGFREGYREMYDILQESQRIRDEVRNGTHRAPRRENDRIAASLHKMDRDFHAIERDLRGWRAAPGSRDAVRLDQLLGQFESTLHDMMEDYGEKSRLPVAASPRPPVSSPVPPARR